MAVFGWIAGEDAPPARWDLRRAGWTLCAGRDGCRAECRHVLICDTRLLDMSGRLALAQADRPAWRLILLGVEDAAERGRLLSMGCAEALSGDTGLHELEARCRRVTDMFGMLPRWRDVGPLTLDLFHRDARSGQRWLGLHPREFSLLWRLADTPGQRVSRRQLVADVWRLNHEPETNSVEVHVSRLRAKLAAAKCDSLVETAPEGGYRLADPRPFMLPVTPVQADALDEYLRDLGWTGAKV
ncbi:winged helix-turn-helix transcriptional regulator [Aurantiacibacter hainanensis]|uniref:winged helix-turn-helix transcriptional regulator n=1 Tax=Aurantiacibacter hainanensis TaxID=3076114 RepID=UPI0030C6B452